MPSPATHLRAPLLWLLGPLMAGLTAARLWALPAQGLWPLALAAVAAGLMAAWLAGRPGRAARAGWAIGMVLSAGLGGFLLLHARHPARPQGEARPPREITVTIRVTQTFPVATTARSLTGLGEITAAGEGDGELVGQRVYYSAIRRISVPPRRSGGYAIRGIIEPLPPDAADGGLNAALTPALLPGASSGDSTRGSHNTAAAGLAGRRPNSTWETPQQAAGNVSAFNDYLANLGIRVRITRAHLLKEVAAPGRFQEFCARAQDQLESILRHGLAGHPELASLYLAMLLGEKAVLSAEQENAFMRSGTFHLFSISGLHVAVIASAVYYTLNLLRIPRRPAVTVCLLVLWFYVQVTGASSPALRAFLMIAFMSASRIFRLPGNALAALVASALATLLLDPFQLFSTGFQMSYTVVVALVAMGRPLNDRWQAAWQPFALLPRAGWGWHHKLIELIGRKVVTSTAICWVAFLASAPSGIGYFQLFSPGSLLANLVVIPLSMVVIWAGFLSFLTGLPGLLPVSVLANTVAALTILAMDWLLRHGTSLPGVWFAARFRADWLAPASLALMTAVMLAGAAGRWAPRYGGFWPPVVLLVLLILLGVKFG